ncbi:MAG: hypothetical protein KDK99_14390 [Verrucomicrobiales bacterium]|nr:hypothetical protein [Verrucomicrobiales bacterium]
MTSRALFLILFLLAGLSPRAEAQLAVYQLEFKPTGESINYRSYESGYYVAPMTGGTGSLVLMLTTGGVKRYFTYDNFGELFVAVSGDQRKVVLTATAANTVSTTTFFAIGDADERYRVETRAAESQVHLARKLQGYSVSADSERDLPFSSGSTLDLGVAGAAHLTATFDEGRTSATNRESRTVAAEITEIETFLRERGFVDGLAGTASAGGGTTGGGTTTPSR